MLIKSAVFFSREVNILEGGLSKSACFSSAEISRIGFSGGIFGAYVIFIGFTGRLWM